MELPLNLTRSVVTIIVPGIVVCAPALLLLVDSYPTIGDLYKAYTGPVNVCSFALVVVVGALIEMTVSYIESHWDGVAAGKPPPDVGKGGWVAEGWFEYLSRRFGDNEPVGYRYLSKMVTSLYFELGMLVSVPLALLALGFLLLRHGACVLATGLFVAALPAVFLLYKSAKDTHGVLCKTRAEINSRLKQP